MIHYQCYIHICFRWPGSSHDQMILNFSKLQAELECGKYGHSYLLGDSGYACKKYMITPLSNPRTTNEMNFNRALVSTRQIVERTIGIWKRRFPILGTSNLCNIFSSSHSLFYSVLFIYYRESNQCIHHSHSYSSNSGTT